MRTIERFVGRRPAVALAQEGFIDAFLLIPIAVPAFLWSLLKGSTVTELAVLSRGFIDTYGSPNFGSLISVVRPNSVTGIAPNPDCIASAKSIPRLR
jgi:hypothetical protein